MIIFNVSNSGAVAISMDEVNDEPEISHHRSMREALSEITQNSCWFIKRISSNDERADLRVEWVSSGGHWGISVLASSQDDAIDAFLEEVTKKYDKEYAKYIYTLIDVV